MSAYEKSFLDLNGVNALWARIKALFVPNTRTVNGQALSSNVTIATPGTLKTNATNAQTASSGEVMSGTITLHKVAKTGTYSDLIGTPTIPTVNNAALKLQLNGGTATSKFTANASSDVTLAFASGSTAGTIKVDSTEVAVAGFGDKLNRNNTTAVLTEPSQTNSGVYLILGQYSYTGSSSSGKIQGYSNVSATVTLESRHSGCGTCVISSQVNYQVTPSESTPTIPESAYTGHIYVYGNKLDASRNSQPIKMYRKYSVNSETSVPTWTITLVVNCGDYNNFKIANILHRNGVVFKTGTMPTYASDASYYVTTANLSTLGTEIASAQYLDHSVTQTEDTTSTSTAFEILFSNTADSTTRTEAARKSAKLKFQPSTGTLTATKFSGPLTGNVTGNVTGNCSGSSGSCTGNAATASKLGTADKGSATKPIYLAAGTPTECTTYAGGTAVTLNNSSKAGSTASFYAPTAGGTANYVLIGNGTTSAPTWTEKAPKAVTADTATSADLTRSQNPSNPYEGDQIQIGTGAAITLKNAMYAYRIGYSERSDNSVGNSITPICIDSNGFPVTCGFTVGTSVPSNAVFTDNKVTQTKDDSSTGTGFEVLFSATADNTTRTETSRKSSKLTFQPSTGILTATRFAGLLDDSASRVGIGYTLNAGSPPVFSVDKTYAEIKSIISNKDRHNTYVSIRNLSGGGAAGINNLLTLSSYDQSPNNTTTLSFTGIDNNVLHYVTISSSDTVTYNRKYLVTSDSANTASDFEPMLTSARGVSKSLGATDGSIIGIHDDNERGGAGIYGIAFNSNGCVRWNGTSYVIQKITPGESNGNQAHQFNGIANYAFNALSASYATTAGNATTATTATTAQYLTCTDSNEVNIKKDPNQSASLSSQYLNYRDADGTASSSIVQLLDYYFCDRKGAYGTTNLRAGHFISTNASTASYGIEVHRNKGDKDTGMLIERSDKTYNGKTFALIYGIGTGGDNYGIWSDPLGCWAIKGVASENKVYIHAGGNGTSANFISFVVGSIGTAANTIYFP